MVGAILITAVLTDPRIVASTKYTETKMHVCTHIREDKGRETVGEKATQAVKSEDS